MLEYNNQALLLLFFNESSVLISFPIDTLSLIEVLEYLVKACDYLSRIVDKLHVEFLISLVDIPCIDLKQSVWRVIHIIKLVFIDSLKWNLLLLHSSLFEIENEFLCLLHNFPYVDVGAIDLGRILHLIYYVFFLLLLDLAARVREGCIVGIKGL